MKSFFFLTLLNSVMRFPGSNSIWTFVFFSSYSLICLLVDLVDLFSLLFLPEFTLKLSFICCNTHSAVNKVFTFGIWS